MGRAGRHAGMTKLRMPPEESERQPYLRIVREKEDEHSHESIEKPFANLINTNESHYVLILGNKDRRSTRDNNLADSHSTFVCIPGIGHGQTESE